MYGPAVQFSRREQQSLQQAQSLLACHAADDPAPQGAGLTATSAGGLLDGSSEDAGPAAIASACSTLAGSVALPDILVLGEAVLLHFQLPAEYPDAPAQLRLECPGPRCAPPQQLQRWVHLANSPNPSAAVATLGAPQE